MRKISFSNDVLPLKNELYRLALRITLNRMEAEDIVQETMLRVWSRRQSWDKIESISAFCLTICRNLALDKAKSPSRNSLTIDESGVKASADTSPSANPAAQTEARDRLDMIKKIMNSLPEKQRTAMHLRDFEGKSYKEIADIMRISEDQVKVNIFRARQTIKRKFTNNK